MTDFQTSLSRADFSNCVRDPAKLAALKLKLEDIRQDVVSHAPRKLRLFAMSPKPGYVSRAWDRGRRQYRKEMWMGFAHRRFKPPHTGVQFQFGISCDSVWSNGIWIDGYSKALRTRKDAGERLYSNLERFQRLLRRLPESYHLELIKRKTGEVLHKYSANASTANRPFLEKFVLCMTDKEIHVAISSRLSVKQTTKLGPRLPAYLAHNFNKLLPIYSLMTEKAPGKRELPDLEKVEPTVLDIKELSRRPRRRRSSGPSLGTQETEVDKACARRAERIVFRHEQGRLRKTGHPLLARKVEDVAHIRGLGYDIKSFAEDGKEIQIEVKSTKAKSIDRFHFRQSEWQAAQKLGRTYHMYFVMRTHTTTPIIVPVSFFSREIRSGTFKMEPSEYLVSSSSVMSA